MANFIVCCDCPQMTQYCLDSYRIMAQSRTYPDIYLHSKTYALLHKLTIDTNVYEFVKNLLPGKKKYAYYIEYDDNGDVTKQWNLLTGKRIIDDNKK